LEEHLALEAAAPKKQRKSAGGPKIFPPRLFSDLGDIYIRAAGSELEVIKSKLTEFTVGALSPIL
jgi:hypothetical protein